MNTQNILNDLIAVPSITGDGKSCGKIIKMAQAILHAKHVSSKVIKTAKRSILIWGELDLEKSEWLINSHLDVVPGKLEQFEPQENKGKLFGRGAADTKGSCAVLLANIENWQSLARAKHLTFMLVTDEEVGGESTKEILHSLPNLKGAVFLEPTGEKLVIQAKGIIQIKITATGKSCHGSRTWEGNNALEKLAHRLTSFRLRHPSPTHETRNTTFNFSLMTAGTAINQVPGKATLWCDIRWNPADNPEDIVASLKLAFDQCLVEVVKLEPPVNCPQSSQLHRDFTQALKANSLNPLNAFEHGSSDARHCTGFGIPSLVFGPKGKNLHADNEWVSLKSLDNVQRVLNTWINNL